LIGFMKLYFCTYQTIIDVLLVVYLLRGVFVVLAAWAKLYLLCGWSYTCYTNKALLGARSGAILGARGGAILDVRDGAIFVARDEAIFCCVGRRYTTHLYLHFTLN
jgi:hypothetical protein